VVECVEELSAELELGTFANVDVLDRRKVPQLKTWAEENAIPGVPKVTECICKGSWTEPLQPRFCHMDRGNSIRARSNIGIVNDVDTARISSRRAASSAAR
jgi:hypothetical protein